MGCTFAATVERVGRERKSSGRWGENKRGGCGGDQGWTRLWKRLWGMCRSASFKRRSAVRPLVKGKNFSVAKEC